MAATKIRHFPDPVLRKACQKVKKFDKNLKQLISTMERVMRSQPMGIGIAAPQIGVAKQVAIVDVSARVKGAQKWVLINPEIFSKSGETLSHEGCMSIPEYTGYLKRFEKIKIRYQDEQGNLVEKSAQGIEAICIQHEYDHLQGKLFLDRVVSLKTDMIPRSWKKRKKR